MQFSAGFKLVKIKNSRTLKRAGSHKISSIQAFKTCSNFYLRVAHWNNGNVRSVVGFFAEFHNAVGQCKERVVFAHSNVFTWVVLRTALTNDDVPCDATLAAKDFDAQPFGL
jgi:hypothetical protein